MAFGEARVYQVQFFDLYYLLSSKILLTSFLWINQVREILTPLILPSRNQRRIVEPGSPKSSATCSRLLDPGVQKWRAGPWPPGPMGPMGPDRAGAWPGTAAAPSSPGWVFPTPLGAVSAWASVVPASPEPQVVSATPAGAGGNSTPHRGYSRPDRFPVPSPVSAWAALSRTTTWNRTAGRAGL